MPDVLSLLLPIFAIIAMGAAFVRLGLFAADGLPAINRLTINACVPVVLFSAVTGGGGLAGFAYGHAALYAAASLAAAAVLAAFLRKGLGEGWPQAFVLALAGSVSNSVFLGFPIASAVIPDRAAETFAWIVLGEILFVIPILTTLALIAEQGRGGVTAAGIAVPLLRSPVTIGLLAGFAFMATGLPMPRPAAQALAVITSAAPFLALFLIGGMLAQADLRAAGPRVAGMVGAKLLLHPALVGLSFALVFGWADRATRDALFFAAIPCFASGVVFCARHGVGTVAASAIVLSTLLGGLTVTALLTVLL